MPKVNSGEVNKKRTICEVHREIYDILSEDEDKNKQAIDLLQEAFTMAKKMNQKLRQYKHNYDDGWWEETKKEIVKEKLKRRKGK